MVDNYTTEKNALVSDIWAFLMNENTKEDKMICRSLISWINDGSHTIPDDLYIDSYTDSIDRYKEIFKEIFVRMGHEAHYIMMMQ